jgi:gliding-associated putative ABC transporter substrate-binding component GldG
MTKKRKEIILLFLTLTVFLLLGFNSLVFYFRADLTENKAYTISKVSKNLFREIPEQVTITYYVSEKLSRFSPIPLQIEDILYEYAAHGRGKIRVSVIDPAKAGQQNKMDQIGIIPQQIQTVEKNEQTLALVYTGIVISYHDSRDVLPVVYDLSTLEYDITSRIKKIITGEKNILGIMSGRSGGALAEEFQLLLGHLSRNYTVREVPKGEEIPPDISVLFILGGAELDVPALRAVDGYIMRGGKALFAVDGVRVDLSRNLEAAAQKDLPVFDVLASYGVRIKPELVLDTQSRRIPVQRNTGRITVQSLEKYDHWVSVQGPGFSRGSPVTARLTGLDLYWPSPLTLLETAGVTAEVIASSSIDSWTMRDRFVTNPYEAPAFRAAAADRSGKFTLAAALTGTFPSGFKDGSLAPRPGAPEAPGESGPVSRETRIIVVGDSDLATDLMRYSDGVYNLNFFENAAAWLSLDDSLLEIKTRAARDLRLNRIEDPRTRNTVILFSQVVNLFAVPGFVLLFGIVRAFRRKERSAVAGDGGRQ